MVSSIEHTSLSRNDTPTELFLKLCLYWSGESVVVEAMKSFADLTDQARLVHLNAPVL